MKNVTNLVILCYTYNLLLLVLLSFVVNSDEDLLICTGFSLSYCLYVKGDEIVVLV